MLRGNPIWISGAGLLDISSRTLRSSAAGKPLKLEVSGEKMPADGFGKIA